MIVTGDITAVREQVKTWQHEGKIVAFVPTMGNLHKGHLTLVKKGLELADYVVASIFVNPLQFGANEDLSSYPSTPDEDRKQLEVEGCAMLFLPTEEVIYPQGRDNITYVDVPQLTKRWCGDSRPTHFRGVSTVVAKLFNIVPADFGVFGQKDFQQLAIIRKMVADLDIDIQIVGVDTVREESGLAMSSRNGYLNKEQKVQAQLLYQTLQQSKKLISSGERDYRVIEESANRELIEGGFEPDYYSVCRQSDLEPADAEDRSLVILAAAKLGPARLIDNIVIEL
jgi:pantoate--beta-alanine ligase